jgi:glycosyltransferase involved in cell wall biosynthesis
MMTISVLILTLNEEINLPGCLESVKDSEMGDVATGIWGVSLIV